jgi:subtilisin family serine protease
LSVNQGFVYILDPTRKVEIIDSGKPWIIPEDYLVTPPSKRPQIPFEKITQPGLPPTDTEREIGDRMRLIAEGKPFTVPPGTGSTKGAPLVPGANRTISTLPTDPNQLPSDEVLVGGYRYGDIRLVNKPEPIRTLTEEQLKNGMFTLSFPAQDRVVGIGDFNKDGRKDLLLRNSSTGEIQIWYMDGQNKIGEAPLINSATATMPATPGVSWVIEGVGDFNNDQSIDLIWRELGGSGGTGIWFMNNNQFIGAQFMSPNNNLATPTYIAPNWRIDGIADFTGDGKNDLLWRDYGSGLQYVWVMNGTSYVSQFQVAPQQGSVPTSWKIVGVSDFNGDGTQDLFWRNDSADQNAYWQMNAGLQSANSAIFFAVGNAAPGWTIEDIGDLDANGKPDIAWKSPDGGHWAWMLGGASVPVPLTTPRVPGNNTSAIASFDPTNGNFHSEFGYGMVDASAAIAYLKNQSPPLEKADSIGFNLSGNNARQNEILNLPEVWQQGNTGQGITVAVIDSGVMLSHPDLNDNIWTNSGEIAGDGIDNDGNGKIDDLFGWDFIGNDSDPSPSSTLSVDSHGTQVAGMIAAEQAVNNGYIVTGGAYNAKIMALRAGYPTYNAQNQLIGAIDLVAATQAVIYAADKGAKVINLSFGGTYIIGDPVQTSFTNAVNYAVNKGAVVVVAAGNGYSNTVNTAFPAILAGLPGVITVGATDAGAVGVTSSNNQASQVASFSTGAGTTVRKYVTAPGYNVLTTSRNPSGGATYEYVLGTSFAAPLVAATVATIKQAVPNATPAQITNALAQTADWSDIYI